MVSRICCHTFILVKTISVQTVASNERRSLMQRELKIIGQSPVEGMNWKEERGKTFIKLWNTRKHIPKYQSTFMYSLSL